MDKVALSLYDEVVRAERELDVALETNSTIEDLETIVDLQLEIDKKMFNFRNYIDRIR